MELTTEKIFGIFVFLFLLAGCFVIYQSFSNPLNQTIEEIIAKENLTSLNQCAEYFFKDCDLPWNAERGLDSCYKLDNYTQNDLLNNLTYCVETRWFNCTQKDPILVNGDYCWRYENTTDEKWMSCQNVTPRQRECLDFDMGICYTEYARKFGALNCPIVSLDQDKCWKTRLEQCINKFG